jgi:glycosyltransferase involved in cell wall biosynthesis
LYVHKKRLEKSILFLSKKTGKQLGKYYHNCLFFVAPSVGSENFPMVLLEAISHNKALVGSNTGGISEIIKDGTNGLLFVSGDDKKLSEKMQLLLDGDRLRQNFERYNLKYKKQFDIKIMSLRTLWFYKKVAKLE